MSKKVAVIAVGGNSLIKDPKNVTVEDQEQALRETSQHIADMIEAGWDVAIGHRNGPRDARGCSVGAVAGLSHRHRAIPRCQEAQRVAAQTADGGRGRGERDDKTGISACQQGDRRADDLGSR